MWGCIRAAEPWFRLVAGLLAGLSLTACGGLLGSDVDPPEVSLAGLGFGEPGLFEQQLRVDLRLRNPNNFDLEIDRVTFNLELNDKPFAHGRANEGLDLPALGETVVPVTINVPTNDLIDRVTELGTEHRLDYRLTGEAELASLFSARVPFHKEGKLALPRLPGLDQPKP
ncbi:MAG TPA: LEA type 2 family protein [Geminicoccaceae bacterium]|jgi:LEA14-like dessication related protein|nr:LEA type 2 family protein [Geminicoccaceae bacterium]